MKQIDLVYEALVKAGSGDRFSIADYLPLDDMQVAKCLSELYKRGLIYKDEKHQVVRRGRKASIWLIGTNDFYSVNKIRLLANEVNEFRDLHPKMINVEAILRAILGELDDKKTEES